MQLHICAGLKANKRARTFFCVFSHIMWARCQPCYLCFTWLISSKFTQIFFKFSLSIKDFNWCFKQDIIYHVQRDLGIYRGISRVRWHANGFYCIKVNLLQGRDKLGLKLRHARFRWWNWIPDRRRSGLPLLLRWDAHKNIFMISVQYGV